MNGEQGGEKKHPRQDGLITQEELPFRSIHTWMSLKAFKSRKLLLATSTGHNSKSINQEEESCRGGGGEQETFFFFFKSHKSKDREDFMSQKPKAELLTQS